MSKYSGLTDCSKLSVVDFPADELKSIDYKLVFESNKNNHDFIRYFD